MLGEEPSEEECEGIDGLITEHYEIAVYGNLALLADRLGESDVGDLLHETLEAETEALETLSGITDGVDYDVAMKPGAAD